MIHVILRTCDKVSLESSRIVNKKECILRCLNSIINALKYVDKKHLHIIDDNSSDTFRSLLLALIEPYDFITTNLLLYEPQDFSDSRQKTRYSVKVAYEYIYNLPDNELVYIVEDDYLHFPTAIKEMVDTWKYLTQITKVDIGIFPQEFNQLYYHPDHKFNDTYFKPCLIVPCKHRYYRTTWYTHESFMIESRIFKKFKHHFDSLLLIGSDPAFWEGNTISNVWLDPSFKMFMPIGPLAIHMSNKNDIPFFVSKNTVIKLWKQNKTFLSLEQDSLVQL